MTSIGIFGSLGRMGMAIQDILATEGVRYAGGVDAGGDPVALAQSASALVDFSVPAALEKHLAAAREAGTPIVIGTTGLDAQHHALIDEAAREIAVLQTGNTSLGVVLLTRLVCEAASRLGNDWDIEIIEGHHRHKLDAPSGTALMLGEAAAAGRGVNLGDVRVDGRSGTLGARVEGTIGFTAIRGGSIVGDHTVYMAGQGERIELTHIAQDRAIFARGAVKAALWLAKQPAGRYSMDAVLGL